MDKKKTEAVVNKVLSEGQVKRRKNSKTTGGIFLGDFKSAIESVVTDVIEPKIRDTAYNVFETFCRNYIYNSKVDPRRSEINRENYVRRLNGRDVEESRLVSKPYGLEYPVISIDSATKVKEELLRAANTYDVITVYNYYDICNVGPVDEQKDLRYGWRNLTKDNIQILSDDDGYYVKMPRPEYIGK